MTVYAPAIVKSLRNALYAYINIDNDGESSAAVRAIAGAILSVQAKAGELVLKGLAIEAWVDELVRDFDVSQVADSVWNEAEKAIAAQAKTWRENLQTKARATLDAYVQAYAPNLDTHQIQATIATILPIVEDAQISRDEAKRVISLVSQQFDGQAAIDRVIDPKWVILAGKAWKAVHNRDIEATVQDVVQAYISKFKPSLVEIGEGLVEQAFKALSNSKGQLDLDFELDPESQRLLVKQVNFKLRLWEASPPPSKTALEFAQQIHSAVAHYRAEKGLNSVSLLPQTTRLDGDATSSSIGGEISIGIEIHPSNKSQNDAG